MIFSIYSQACLRCLGPGLDQRKMARLDPQTAKPRPVWRGAPDARLVGICLMPGFAEPVKRLNEVQRLRRHVQRHPEIPFHDQGLALLVPGLGLPADLAQGVALSADH